MPLFRCPSCTRPVTVDTAAEHPRCPYCLSYVSSASAFIEHHSEEDEAEQQPKSGRLGWAIWVINVAAFFFFFFLGIAKAKTNSAVSVVCISGCITTFAACAIPFVLRAMREDQ